MDPFVLAAWIIGCVILVVGVYVVGLSLRERKARAALVGGLFFAFMAVAWLALVYAWPFGLPSLVLAAAGATAIKLALLLLPFGRGGSPEPLPEPTERVDERAIMFARARYRPGDGKYEPFYEDYPGLREIDDSLRQMPALGRQGSATWDPLNAPLHEAMFEWIERVRDTAGGPVAPERVRLGPDEATERLKGLALALGAVSAGTTAVRPGHVYSRIGRGSGHWGAKLPPERYKWALVFAVEMDDRMMRAAPMQPEVVDSARQYVEAAKIALAIAQYLRRLGYSARAHIDGNYRLVLPPLAADAGLGEIGRLSLLITPEVGPRVRLGAVTADLELRQAQALRFGVEDFCRHCLKCARNCPAGAISKGGKARLRGTEYWRIDPERCFRYWLRTGSDCGLCIAVCPYSHPRALMHSFVRTACRRSALSRRLFSLADDLFYGGKPRSRRYPGWMKAGMQRDRIESLRIH